MSWSRKRSAREEVGADVGPEWKRLRPCGAYIATTAEVAEAEKNPNDISTLYGVDINRGLEGCLSLTVKKESLGEYYIFLVF